MRNSTQAPNWTEIFVSAPSELTDHEILDRYGILLRDAVSAFQADPTYLVKMAETAANLKTKREQRALKRAG